MIKIRVGAIFCIITSLKYLAGCHFAFSNISYLKQLLVQKCCTEEFYKKKKSFNL